MLVPFAAKRGTQALGSFPLREARTSEAGEYQETNPAVLCSSLPSCLYPTAVALLLPQICTAPGLTDGAKNQLRNHAPFLCKVSACPIAATRRHRVAEYRTYKHKDAKARRNEKQGTRSEKSPRRKNEGASRLLIWELSLHGLDGHKKKELV